MLILGTSYSWGRQLICCLDIPGMSLFVGEVFYFCFFLWWKLPDMCDTQVVAKESSSWEKKLSIQFEVNFTLDVQGNVIICFMEFGGWDVLDTILLLKMNFLCFPDFVNVALVMLHALLHLHGVYVMSSSFPINTLLQFLAYLFYFRL